MNVDARDVFVLRERHAVLVRLPSFEWDFTLGLRVLVSSSSGSSLEMQQIGTGNLEGRATILLSPYEDWGRAEEQLRAVVAGGVLALTSATS